MTSLPSVRTKVHPPLHVSQCEMRHSNPMLQPSATRVSFGGKLHGQLLFWKTNVNFEASYKFVCSLNMSTKRRKKIKRERERKRERRRWIWSKNTSRKDTGNLGVIFADFSRVFFAFLRFKSFLSLNSLFLLFLRYLLVSCCQNFLLTTFC